VRYLGGKIRLGKKIADVINTFQFSNYTETFCGLFSVGQHVQGIRTASDIHPDLILMMQALQRGWEPPETVSEDLYKILQYDEPSALRGFVGFGCSFYGKFFGGYARDKHQSNYALMARNSLLKIVPAIQDVRFKCQDYRDCQFENGCLIYCDPPYVCVTDYSCGQFNNDEFWNWVRKQQHIIIISEYNAPDDFEVIWQQPITTGVKDKTGHGIHRIEKLFKLKN
jgi:DNA adenine methylase